MASWKFVDKINLVSVYTKPNAIRYSNIKLIMHMDSIV